MKRLTLLRHAKSGEDAEAARDFDRRLNAKGKRAARAIGRYLREHDLAFDAALASPAQRVAETIEEVGAGYGAPLDPRWEKRIYLASADELLDLLRDAPPAAERLLLVGHNPGLEDLVLLLAAGGEARDTVAVKYPTASLAEMELDIDRWADVDAGSGHLVRFVRPRDLDPQLGPDYE
ncbi:SixA phosphatase family protein [Sphingomonas nostoxanthinifaciens]|uniref:SixA phosphatase family protein n=1 Tax=Sphingomonas nostoxanthinifaciens TaxID=2872652 RepID=UPI001CC1F6C8|nr:histidine phosphatase family protein [Sphingomonas nostoxanthinifaciens]UAK24723.1 histidine phosphatase family protein [Sphingomonas nostoxanthinifaciens]